MSLLSDPTDEQNRVKCPLWSKADLKATNANVRFEYTGAGDGLSLKMLVLHDDAKREYAYGPAEGLPDTKVGTFSQDLYDEAKKDGWIVISMKNDWKRIFAFETTNEGGSDE